MGKIALYNPLLNATTILIAVQLGAYIYSASLPQMQVELHSSVFLINSTLTIFVLMSGVSQLFIGALSDRYDNRALILISLIMFIISTISIGVISNIYGIIILRGVQGLVAGCLSVFAKGILQNNYSADEIIKYLALYAIASTLIPAVSPFLSGVLQNYFNWRATFIFMAAYLSAILIYFYFRLISALPRQYDSGNSLDYIVFTFSKYYQILKSPTFMNLALSNAIIFYIEIIEISFSSFILQLKYHISPIHYGIIMAISACGFIIGSLLVLRGKKFFSERQLIVIGISILFFSGIILFLNSFIQWDPLIVFILAVTIVNIALAISVSPIVAKAFTLYQSTPGISIAFMGFTQMTGSSLLSYVINNFLVMTQECFGKLLILMSIVLFALIIKIYKALQ